MSMVDIYGTKEETLYEYNAKFPVQLKKSILQWAVQGRLVPQDPNDEPASILLERIRAEKQRLVKEGKIKKEQIEIDDTLNIDLGNEEMIGINILRKNITLFISNDAARERIIRSIKLNGGTIVNNIDENTDILVYQPSSQVNEVLEMAKDLNIEVFTLGEFNKRLIINK